MEATYASTKVEPSYLPPSPPPDVITSSTSYPHHQHQQPIYGYEVPPTTTTGATSDRPSDQHVYVHEWTPSDGVQGTPVTVRCDINYPPTSTSSDPLEPPAPLNQGKALRVVFGSHPVQTSVQLLPPSGQSTGGQTCLLTAIAPSLLSTGVTNKSNRVYVYLQVLDEHHTIVESIQLGEFIYMTPKSEWGLLTIGGGPRKHS